MEKKECDNVEEKEFMDANLWKVETFLKGKGQTLEDPFKHGQDKLVFIL